MLCWNVYVCLMRIDSYDELMSDVRDGTLIYTIICDIANKSLNCNMMPRYWVICFMLLSCMIDNVNTVAEPKT